MLHFFADLRQHRRLRKIFAPFVETRRTRIAALDFAHKPAADRLHITVAKAGNRLTVLASRPPAEMRGDTRSFFKDRLPVVLDLVSRLRAQDALVDADLTDGEWIEPLDPGVRDYWRLAFCSDRPQALLVPDHDFFNSNGYLAERNLGLQAPPWRARSDLIVWRGATTGEGALPDGHAAMDDPALLPRIRLCALLRDKPGINARIYAVVQSPTPDLHRQRLEAAGLYGDRVPVADWANHKFALDIDGNSNAWSNPFARMLLGCCVIKVESPRGYRQWYYDRMRPWEHYIPVRPDLTNLADMIDWCRSNPDRCEEVAATGQALAHSITCDSAMREAVDAIDRRLAETS